MEVAGAAPSGSSLAVLEGAERGAIFGDDVASIVELGVTGGPASTLKEG